MARRLTRDEDADFTERNILLVSRELDKMYDILSKNEWDKIEDEALRKVSYDRHIDLLKKFQDLNKDFMEQVGIMDIYRRHETGQRKMRAGFSDCAFHKVLQRNKGK